MYISTGRGKTSVEIEELDFFSEPALYWVRPNGELYLRTIQNMSFACPYFDDILNAVKFVVEKYYLGGGEVFDLKNR